MKIAFFQRRLILLYVALAAVWCMAANPTYAGHWEGTITPNPAIMWDGGNCGPDDSFTRTVTLSVTASYNWVHDDPSNPSADPPPSKVNLVERGTASWSAVREGPNWSADGSANNGLGSLYTTGPSDPDSNSKFGKCEGVKTETDVDSSSGTIERSRTLTATVTVTTGDGTWAHGSADCEYSMSISNVHAHPVNFRLAADVGFPEAKVGRVNLLFIWDSSDGQMSHLNQCDVGEYLIYPSSDDNDRYSFPPPFNIVTRSPEDYITQLTASSNFASGAKGSAGGFEDRITNTGTWSQPYHAASVFATQYVLFRCLQCMRPEERETLAGPFTVSWDVYTGSSPSGWEFTASWNGFSSLPDPLP